MPGISGFFRSAFGGIAQGASSAIQDLAADYAATQLIRGQRRWDDAVDRARPGNPSHLRSTTIAGQPVSFYATHNGEVEVRTPGGSFRVRPDLSRFAMRQPTSRGDMEFTADERGDFGVEYRERERDRGRSLARRDRSRVRGLSVRSTRDGSVDARVEYVTPDETSRVVDGRFGRGRRGSVSYTEAPPDGSQFQAGARLRRTGTFYGGVEVRTAEPRGPQSGEYGVRLGRSGSVSAGARYEEVDERGNRFESVGRLHRNRSVGGGARVVMVEPERTVEYGDEYAPLSRWRSRNR